MLTESPHGIQTVIFGKLAEYTLLEFEPVGIGYRRHCLQKYHSCNDFTQPTDLSSEESDDDTNDIEIEDDIAFLRSLDPKEWKKQDHYAVLGLKTYRISATDDLIKKAYRKKVLLHHPDKRRSRGETIRDADNDYFTCITKAYEILGNPAKRCSYDSVDPEFDDSIPPVTPHSKENFYEIFTDVFSRNARWSNKVPVPDLGDNQSTFGTVDAFYSFWYNFDSWREFSYLDEEEKEKGESREERKWIEKQNKAARQKRKKEESARVRQLVDNAYACDPRVQKFKEEERQRKLAQKKAKQEAVRAKAEEEEKKRLAALESERKAKEKEEEEARLQAESAKKAKEALKKALKKEKKTLRTLCKDFNYFTNNDSEIVTNMAELDKLCELLPLSSIEELNKSLLNCDAIKGREVFLQRVKELNEKLEKEKEELFNLSQKSSLTSGDLSNQKNWSQDDVQLLIKAVNLFPAGTNQRWEVVANYINQHSVNVKECKRTAKEVLTKAKELQKSDFALKEEANKQAYHKFEKSQKPTAVGDEAAPTERFDSAADLQGINPAPWTAEEQRLLEQALKTYSTATPNRWDCIAECIPGRSKKDCMKRYKDLVEMVKAKKAAQAGVTNKKPS